MSELIIEAGHAGCRYWADLWRYCALFSPLSWRDILVFSKQTVIVSIVVFVKLAIMPSDFLIQAIFL